MNNKQSCYNTDNGVLSVILSNPYRHDDIVHQSLVLLAAFYRIFPKIPLPKSMQTFLEMSTNLNYSICKFNTSSFKIRVDEVFSLAKFLIIRYLDF